MLADALCRLLCCHSRDMMTMERWCCPDKHCRAEEILGFSMLSGPRMTPLCQQLTKPLACISWRQITRPHTRGPVH